MTRDEALLKKLDGWRPAGPGPHTFNADLPGGADCSLTAEQGDALSCQVTEVAVRLGPAGACSAAELTQRAVQAAQQVTGLLEPLRVYEIDAGRSAALLRSQPPAVRGEQVFYYELALSGLHAATLRRYRAAKAGGSPREPIPFVLTHEAIAKLVADVSAAD